jgi:hypothetical protein
MMYIHVDVCMHVWVSMLIRPEIRPIIKGLFMMQCVRRVGVNTHVHTGKLSFESISP